MICIDDYGNEIYTCRAGQIASVAHDVFVESPGSRQQKGLNWRGIYHKKCIRCQLVWMDGTLPPSVCYPHIETQQSGYTGKNSMPTSALTKQVDTAWGHLYRKTKTR